MKQSKNYLPLLILGITGLSLSSCVSYKTNFMRVFGVEWDKELELLKPKAQSK